MNDGQDCNRDSEKLINFLLAMIATLLFYILSEFGKNPGAFYLSADSLRSQVDSIYHGQLALKDAPFFNQHDNVWGNGLQQIWGLGVPILLSIFRLPLMLLPHHTFFPEYLLLFIFYFCTAWLMMTTIDRLKAHVKYVYLDTRKFKISVLLLTLLSSSYVALVGVRASIYELPPAIGILTTFILYFSLICYIVRRSQINDFVIPALSGFCCLIKVTYFFYGLSAFAIFLWLNRRSRLKTLFRYGVLYSLSPVFLLVSNYLRFGSMWEFGYRLNMSGIIRNDLALRFGYPYSSHSWMSSLRELYLILFFDPKMNGHGYFVGTLFKGETLPFRFREIYFSTFNYFHALLLLAALVFPIIAIRMNRKKDIISNKIGLYSWLFGISNFVFLTLFYAKSPSLASRYLVDFIPAIGVGIISLFFFLSKMGKDVLVARRINSAFLFTVCFVSIFSFYHFRFSQGHKEMNLTVDEKTSDSTKLGFEFQLKLPSYYRCPDSFDYNILYNLAGWSRQGSDDSWRMDCQPSLMTTLFFSHLQCLDVDVWVSPYFNNTSQIEVKANLEYMRRVSEEVDGLFHSIKFCRATPMNSVSELRDFQMVSIKWVDLKDEQNHPPNYTVYRIAKSKPPIGS